MRYFAHRNKRPFHLKGYKDCWIIQDNSGNHYVMSTAVGRLPYQPINWNNYKDMLADIGTEVSGIGSLTMYPEELRVDEGL